MEIIDIYNNRFDTDCLGCSIAKGEYVPPGRLVFEDEYFCVNQDCEIPIPGFTIIAPKRHIRSIDELSKDELADFIELVARIRRAQREVLDIHQVDLIMVENPEDHFHFWLLPISKEMLKKFGFGTKTIKPIMNYARDNLKTPEQIKLIEESVEKLRNYLAR